MRQHGQLGRQAKVGERLGDVGFPRARAYESFAKPVRLAQLEAHFIRSVPQARGGAFISPEIADLLIVFGQRAAIRGRDAAQRSSVLVLPALHDLLPLAWRGVRIEMQGLVDSGQIVLVMEEAAVGIDLRVHAHPELNIALQLRRPGHRRVRGDRARGDQQSPQEPQQHAAIDGAAPHCALRGRQASRHPCRVHLHPDRSIFRLYIQWFVHCGGCSARCCGRKCVGVLDTSLRQSRKEPFPTAPAARVRGAQTIA